MSGPGLEIRASASPGEIRVALLKDGELQAYAVERAAQPDQVGELHRARVSAIAPAMSGAFMALAGEETGFLPESEVHGEKRPVGRAVQQGQILHVRVIRAGQGGKGPRVTARLSAEELAFAAAASEGAPRLLRRGPGATLRLAEAHPTAVVLTDGAPLAARLRAALGPARVRLSPTPVFDEVLEGEAELLAGPEVPLPGGGRLLVHPTPALTALDVDAGSHAGSGDPLAQRRLNEQAAAEAARQIRLRELAGAIMLDFAGLRPKAREALLPALEAALAEDPLRPRLLGLTRLGFAEIQRSRVHPPLHEVLGMPPSALTHGLAALRRAARDAAARPGRRFGLRAAPSVCAALRDQAGTALQEFAAGAGFGLDILVDAALRPGQEEFWDDPAPSR
jgi:hypothetical protein